MKTKGSQVERDEVSRTERFAIMEDGKIVSRAYLRIPYGYSKPIFMFKVKTNKSHIRQGLCRKVIEKVIESYGRYDISLRPSQMEPWGMPKKKLIKFYESFEFVQKKDKERVYGTMVRKGVI